MNEDIVCKGSFILGTDCGTCSRCKKEKKEIIKLLSEAYKFKKALDNCYMLARKQRRNFADATADAISWDHVIRFCEEVGCKSSILR